MEDKDRILKYWAEMWRLKRLGYSSSEARHIAMKKYLIDKE